jgi:DNA-binding response OmpR family regulator
MIPKKRNGYVIFVADDDPVAQAMIRETFLDAGYEVTVMGNGQEILDNITPTRPDLLILDVMMPGINGYNVAHKIKFDSPRSDMPIIMLTSEERIVDQRFGLMLDIDYLRKPCSCGDLLLKVNRILNVKP